MKNLLVILMLVMSFGIVGCNSTVAPTPTPEKACVTNNTATVFFSNQSVTNATYSILWDGIVIAVVAPGQNSQTITTTAGVVHFLEFKKANSSQYMCTVSYPVLTQCAASSYFCRG